jgi:hypothetical protein
MHRSADDGLDKNMLIDCESCFVLLGVYQITRPYWPFIELVLIEQEVVKCLLIRPTPGKT